jgi:hypothetical protein
MKQTQHHDPFEYSQYQDNSFFDFSWENDKWTIVAVGVGIALSAGIYLFGVVAEVMAK